MRTKFYFELPAISALNIGYNSKQTGIYKYSSSIITIDMQPVRNTMTQI